MENVQLQGHIHLNNIKCPLCNKSMEKGYLKRRQFFSVLKWTPEKITKNYFKDSVTLRFGNLESKICKECNIIIIKYTPDNI